MKVSRLPVAGIYTSNPEIKSMVILCNFFGQSLHRTRHAEPKGETGGLGGAEMMHRCYSTYEAWSWNSMEQCSSTDSLEVMRILLCQEDSLNLPFSHNPIWRQWVTVDNNYWPQTLRSGVPQLKPALRPREDRVIYLLIFSKLGFGFLLPTFVVILFWILLPTMKKKNHYYEM